MSTESNDPFPPAALVSAEDRVRPDWIDYNGHMNVAYYVLAFDHGTDRFLAMLGLDAEYLALEGGSTFALEMHITYERELRQDEPYIVRTQLIDADNKRIHMYHELRHAEEGWLAATNEVITMHIDLATRRSAVFPTAIQASVEALKTAHAHLPRPDRIGRTIGIRHRPA